MYQYNKCFSSEGEKAEFIKMCDGEFFARLKSASYAIASDESVRYVLLSGPSCSGKTSATQVVTQTLTQCGKNVLSVSIDDFFNDSSEFKNVDTEVDFDSINALDYKYFCHCVDSLKKDKTADIPIFDFVTGKRNGYRRLTASDDTVIIFEGIQALYPQISSLFDKNECKSVFLCVDTDVYAYGNEFSSRSLRFARRLVRDWYFRGACPEMTFKLWSGVVRNEEENILPYANTADFIVDSFVPYEINVLAPLVLQVLAQLPDISKYCSQAIAMAKKYENVPIISSEHITQDSFFTEFIG